MNDQLNRQKHNYLYLILGFFIPFVGMTAVMIVNYLKYGKSPDFLILNHDMLHQYYPFFCIFRKKILNGSSLFYSWNVGMGVDYWGLIAYYLSSPLNLFSIFVPDRWVLQYFCMLVPLKLGFAGLFFSIFLKELFKNNDFSISIFGGFYALCAWALGYYWNVIWLDTFAIFPLVVLGAIWLLRDRRYFLYTAALFFSVLSNYYIGLFVCIFIFLLFFAYEFCRWKGPQQFIKDFLCIAVFSILAIGMTLFLTLPSIAALGKSQASAAVYTDNLSLNCITDGTLKSFFIALKQIAGNLGDTLKPTFLSGLPNVACGVGTVFLAVLFLTTHKIQKRDRLCSFTLLIFLVLSFVIPQLNYIWHGFHFPNMIPYRFSFLFSFVILVMAYRAWLHRKDFSISGIVFAAVVSVGIFFCSDNLFSQRSVELIHLIVELPLYYAHNLLFLLFFVVIFLLPGLHAKDSQYSDSVQSTGSKKAAPTNKIFFILCIAELVTILNSWGSYLPKVNLNDVFYETENAKSAVQIIQDEEDISPVFRSEATHLQTYNDGGLLDYYGVTTFNSYANVHVTHFFDSLGYSGNEKLNCYAFCENSPIANLFINLKYIIEREGYDRSSTWFMDKFQAGNVHLLQNNAYLPLGFLADNQLSSLDFFEQEDVFKFQDRLLSSASGMQQPCWHILPEDSCNVAAEHVKIAPLSEILQQASENPENLDVFSDFPLSDLPGEKPIAYTQAENDALITYQFVADRTGLLCFDLFFPQDSICTVKINGEAQTCTIVSFSQILTAGEVQPGDLAEISVYIPENESGYLAANAAILDADAFYTHYNILSKSLMEITHFEDTHLEGTISCDRDGLLYTSIPQNGYWHVSVDGEEVETVLIGDCMLSVPLTKGPHSISFHYKNTAFYQGLAVSLLCLAVLLAIVFLHYHKLHGKNKRTN